uniref:SH2 domain-containing protein n=2 Tax=Caenorhabditis japonica TaxID=281687 RepID=A0A8R1HZK4_CAEJA
MSTTPGTPHSVSSGLMEQGWYWADADRQTVSKALSDQPDGSFIVRNASQPGDFTLSVKFSGQVKLLRIVVHDGKCGFNLDSLTHDSVIRLIEFHSKISLNIFNDALNVQLLYPVSARRNSQNGKPMYRRAHLQQRQIVSARNDHDWRERLELERLRAANLAFERASKLYDSSHREKERAESLYHALGQSVRDNEKKLEKMKDLLFVEARVVVEVEESKSASDMLKTVFVKNKAFLEESIRRIGTELSSSVEKKKQLTGILEEIEQKNANSKTRLFEFLTIRNTVYDEMDPSLTTRMAAIFDACEEMINSEPTKVTQLLVDMELKWHPEKWLMCGTSKENAANALVHARYRVAQLDKALGVQRDPIDGIFLVRGSSSHSDKLVLSVLHGERVSHCLIEQNEDGWGFEHSNVYMPTIADFIRYYTVYSLETHADAIKTPLKMPAFDEISPDKSKPLRNGPGQIFPALPISKKYMAKALLTDDPFKPPLEANSPEPTSSTSSTTSSLEKPDSLSLRSLTLRDSIPE